MATKKAKVTGGVAAAVLVAAAGTYMATQGGGPVAGACVHVLTGQCQALAAGALCPQNYRPVVSCDDFTQAEYPVATTDRFCYRQQSGECWPRSQFPNGCPIGTIEVSQCGVLPTAVPATPVPSTPVPPISGTPAPFPTPCPTVPSSWGTPSAASVTMIQGKSNAMLVVDGVVIRTWGYPSSTSNQWQATFQWSVVPMISGGS